MKLSYDFVVIGGGSAGFAAARTAAAEGLSVLVAEGGEEVGGLCILRGCMPSKTLLASANRFAALRNLDEFGIAVERAGYSSCKIRTRKEKLISGFAAHRRAQLESGKFDFVRATARFLSQRQIALDLPEGESRVVDYRYAVIATGSVQGWPKVDGLDQPGILTSDDLLRTADVPPSVIVLGGGAVALEAAHFYHSMGAKVTVIQRSNQILREMDIDVAKELESSLQKRGIQFFTGTKLHRIERDGTLWTVRFEHEAKPCEASAAALFNGLGRVPNTASLGLENAGIETESNGSIRVRFTQQTNLSHIFAAGDVCGPYEVVHIAIQQGEIAARNAARLCRDEGEPLEEISYRLKVFAVFTEPQLAAAGFLESELQKMNIPYHVATHPFEDHGKSLVENETEGFVKLLTHSESGEILGAAVVGPLASELIHEVIVAMRYGAKVQEFALIPHYHPTLSEIWTYPAEELAEKVGKRST